MSVHGCSLSFITDASNAMVGGRKYRRRHCSHEHSAYDHLVATPCLATNRYVKTSFRFLGRISKRGQTTALANAITASLFRVSNSTVQASLTLKAIPSHLKSKFLSDPSCGT